VVCGGPAVGGRHYFPRAISFSAALSSMASASSACAVAARRHLFPAHLEGGLLAWAREVDASLFVV